MALVSINLLPFVLLFTRHYDGHLCPLTFDTGPSLAKQSISPSSKLTGTLLVKYQAKGAKGSPS